MSHKSMRRIDRQRALIARLVAIACIFYGSYVVAELHLGELKMLSATGEPLRAQIPVGQADISIEEAVIDVNLASDAMFERAGLTRDIYLAGVELSIARNSLGDLIVEVVADKPIDRPYIDFLVQLDLPEGRIIREYRLLRNPYAVIDQPYRPAFESNSLEKSELLTKVVQPRIYKHRVVAGDTLWNVAKRLRPSHMTMVETMDRLYATNPDAFLDGDSTKLRKGYVVSFTSAPEVADPVAKQSEVSSSISEPDIELIPIVDSQPSASTPNDSPTELADIDVQAQPVVEQAEAPDKQEVPAVVAQQSVTEERVVLQPDVIQETPDLPVVESSRADTVVTQTPDKALPLTDESVAPITVAAKFIDVAQIKDFFSIEPQQLKHWLTRLQQLPKDLWVIAVVFLLAILVNWRRKSRDANKEPESLSLSTQQQPSNSDDRVSDELADSVLDGPFASSHDDDVFNQEHDADAEVQQVVEEGAQIPGAQTLESQLNQEIQKSQADEYQTDDYADDDTVDLDPLTIRLDMATLCIEMGDIENAQAVLEEVISEADSDGKAKARAILDSIET